MKVLHVADLHYSPKNYKNVNEAFDKAIEIAVERNCELAVIAGDSFDHAMNLHEPAVNAFFSRIIKIGRKMNVCLLGGTPTHDPNGSFDVMKNLAISPYSIWVADRPESMEMHNFHWNAVHSPDEIDSTVTRAIVCALPGLNKAQPAVMQMGARDWVEDMLSDWAPINEVARREKIPTILVAHGTVNGCITESEFAMISNDHEFSRETLVSSEVDAVMLGHIHQHQYWDCSTPSGADCTIAYPGSIIRLIHGHNRQTGFLIWSLPDCHLASGAKTCEFIPVENRRMMDLSFDGIPDYEKMAKTAEELGVNDAIRIRWQIDEEYAGEVDKARIRKIFEHVSDVKLEAQINPIQRTRSAGITRFRSLEDKLKAWAESTKTENEQISELIERLRLLSQLVEEEVIRITREKTGV